MTRRPVASEREGHDLVVVANRLPVTRDAGGTWAASPGGLVRALLPVAQRAGGAWVGWPGTTDAAAPPRVAEGVRLVQVALDTDDVHGFYDGFANTTLWPLYHDATRASEFDQASWDAYVRVNRRFAQITARTAAPGATVWVHDYHLQLVPELLREARPDLHLAFFLHIPFPPVELFARLPWRNEILAGLLAADVIGVQTELAARNLIEAARYLTGARPAPGGLVVGGRRVRVEARPVSIDTAAFDELARRPAVEAEAAELRRRLGNPRRLLLGVDRLDYTKGIARRLEAFEALRARPGNEGCVFVQVAVPSRSRLAHYADERAHVEYLVGRINGEHGELGSPAVHYVHRNLATEDLVALYRAADVMVVTPWRDGMNLVAKEYVASRVDERGVLVLSEFAGAAGQLADALLVNPHHTDELTGALQTAVTMSARESGSRMRRLRRVVAEFDAHRWAASVLPSTRHRRPQAGPLEAGALGAGPLEAYPA
ncbi:MAG: trehalose-6-phosphate synthase [Acidimicrobiales bacterium]|nr:trehalose-6-phosphate synthase [Acidimicrobiales bacterium]